MAHHPRRAGRLLVEAQGARQGRRRSRTPRPLCRPRRPGGGLPAHLRQRHPLDGRPRQRPRRRREPGPARVESSRGRSHPRQQHHAPRGLRAVHSGRTRQRRSRARGARDRQPSERLGARARSGMRPEHYDVVVIGGGQAGLAIGYHLAQQGRRFTILEAAGEPASAWRGRWDSLRLFTSVRYDSLPGLDFPGDPDSYPGRDDVIAYLTDYAQRFELPVEFNSRVQAVRARDGGGFLVELADRTYEADQVVVATGPFQVPLTPPVAAGLEPEVVQLHSSRYRSPDDLPTGTSAPAAEQPRAVDGSRRSGIARFTRGRRSDASVPSSSVREETARDGLLARSPCARGWP